MTKMKLDQALFGSDSFMSIKYKGTIFCIFAWCILLLIFWHAYENDWYKIHFKRTYNDPLTAYDCIESGYYTRGFEWIMDGKRILFYRNKIKASEAHYRDGYRFGESTSWHENGKIRSKYNWYRYEKNGEYASFYDNGQKRVEGRYRMDAPVETWHWWKRDGELIATHSLPDGTGVWCSYYENGEKEEQKEYLNGKQMGKSYTWNEKGQKVYEAEFKDGVLHGFLKIWGDNGKLMRNEFYVFGKKHAPPVLPEPFDSGK